MRDAKTRLYELMKECDSFGVFLKKALGHNTWYIKPYVEDGQIVTNAWMIKFWELYKNKKAV